MLHKGAEPLKPLVSCFPPFRAAQDEPTERTEWRGRYRPQQNRENQAKQDAIARHQAPSVSFFPNLAQPEPGSEPWLCLFYKPLCK